MIASFGHWEKRLQPDIITLFDVLSINVTFLLPKHYPDIPKTPSRHPQTPPDTSQTLALEPDWMVKKETKRGCERPKIIIFGSNIFCHICETCI